MVHETRHAACDDQTAVSIFAFWLFGEIEEGEFGGVDYSCEICIYD